MKHIRNFSMEKMTSEIIRAAAKESGKTISDPALVNYPASQMRRFFYRPYIEDKFLKFRLGLCTASQVVATIRQDLRQRAANDTAYLVDRSLYFIFR